MATQYTMQHKEKRHEISIKLINLIFCNNTILFKTYQVITFKSASFVVVKFEYCCVSEVQFKFCCLVSEVVFEYCVPLQVVALNVLSYIKEVAVLLFRCRCPAWMQLRFWTLRQHIAPIKYYYLLTM